MRAAHRIILFLLCFCVIAPAGADSPSPAPQDVALMSVKVVRGKDTPDYIKIDGQYYPGFKEWPFLEVRFSTEALLFEIKDAWHLVNPRATFCRDWAKYTSPAKLIKPPPLEPPSIQAVPVIDADIDRASFSSSVQLLNAVDAWLKRTKPYVYRIYLNGQAPAQETSFSSYAAYDLLAQPEDICVGIMGWTFPEDTSQRSNVMIIPKEAIAAAVDMENREPQPPSWKGSAGSHK